MAYQSRQPRYQEAPYRYEADNYAGQRNGHGQQQYNDHTYLQDRREQQWQQQQQHEEYAADPQYSNTHEHAYDDRYDHNVSGYHDQHYPQPQYQEQDYVPQPPHARQYEYDDRYGDDSPASLSRPGTSASSRRMKQDRILDKAESPKAVAWDNPFGAFPGTKKAIEKKKKDAVESRSQSRIDSPAGRPSTSSSNRVPIPGTSKKQSLEEQRPHTSQGRQQPPAALTHHSFGQSPAEAMPLRKKLPTEYHEDYGQVSPPIVTHSRSQEQTLLMRPAVQRSATVPLPEAAPVVHDVRAMPQNMSRYSNEQQTENNTRFDGTPGYTRNGSREIRYDSNHAAQRYQHNGPNAATNARTNNERIPQNTHDFGRVSQDSYGSPQSVSGAQVVPNNRFSDRLPDFSAINSGVGSPVDRELGLQSGPRSQEPKPQIYRKPTYGDTDSRPPPIRPGLVPPQESYPPIVNNISTPTGGFDFGLPLSTPTHDNFTRGTQNERPRQSEQENRYTDQHQQYPLRGGSRIPPQTQRPMNGFSHPYNQPPRRQEPVLRSEAANPTSQRQPPPRQEYGFDEHGYPQQQHPSVSRNARTAGYNNDLAQGNVPPSNRPLARTYTEPMQQPGDDRYNHGYEQPYTLEPPNRAYDGYSTQQPRADSMRSAQEPGYDRTREVPPPRPRTANSSRAPPQQSYNQPMPAYVPPKSDYAIADRNHPVPIRPGLMDQAPRPTQPPAPVPVPPSQQISPPRNLPSNRQHSRQSSDVSSQKPVTIQELNDLRNAFKEKPNDDKLGLRFAKRLVEAGSVLASEGGKADPKTTIKNRERYINDAYRIVKKLVSTNSAEATFYLADCYGQGQLGLEANPKEAFQLYTSAAKLGHAQSTYRVAVCCELGPDGGGGTRRDHFKAVQFYKKAATLGDGPAMFKMGMILLKGLLGSQPNRREGISWLKRAAERADEDNPHALHELASLYENAQSTDVLIRDERYALQLYMEAADLGYKYSQWRLGSAYEYGTLGCQIDPRQSIGWYTRAAAQGEHQSEFALSGWYLTGSEPLLAQSDQEAYLWARKAASSGLSKAEYAMGYYTEVGIGCRSDIEEAKKWYFRAAAQSDNRAKERLEEIKRGGARKEKTKISRTNVGRQNEGECTVM